MLFSPLLLLLERNAARLFRQLSEALHYLHDGLKVVHRDIKMENILISMNGNVKLADFGFARYADKATRSTSFCGTLLYSSPQLLNHVPYDGFAADWFAAGIVLFTMLMGKYPFVCFIRFLGVKVGVTIKRVPANARPHEAHRLS